MNVWSALLAWFVGDKEEPQLQLEVVDRDDQQTRASTLNDLD